MALHNLLNLYREVKWHNEECVGIMRLKNDPWRSDAPSYDRTWSEIEAMLESATSEMKSQRAKYKLRKISGPREAKYRTCDDLFQAPMIEYGGEGQRAC